jgi:hypothetical protein
MPEDSLNAPIVHDSGVPVVVTSTLNDPKNRDLKEPFDNWEPAPVEEETPPSAPVEKPEELVEAETKQATKPETDVQQEAPEEVEKRETNFERRVKHAPTEQDIKDDLEPPKAKTDADFEAMELRSDAQKIRSRNSASSKKLLRNSPQKPRLIGQRSAHYLKSSEWESCQIIRLTLRRHWNNSRPSSGTVRRSILRSRRNWKLTES